nr:RNA-directed DNA polymerase, eukaryota, reverse transcriptase zinc-binding domain protein [Tanacetum cinerariifolium]
MRSKRTTKIPLKFDDSVNSINNTKTNNKKNESKNNDSSAKNKFVECGDNREDRESNMFRNTKEGDCSIDNGDYDGNVVSENTTAMSGKETEAGEHGVKRIKQCNEHNFSMDSTRDGVSGKQEENTCRKSFVTAISVSLIDNDRNIECIPIEIDENGVEVVVFDDIMVAKGNIVDCNNRVFFMKFHHEEGLNQVGISAIASRIRKPLVMDAVTASKCKQGIRMVRFTRVLIEVCNDYGVFGHADNSCPKWKSIKPTSVNREKDNTFISDEGKSEKTKKKWYVHKYILDAMKRSSNKFTVFEMYDVNEQNELKELRSMEIVDDFLNKNKCPSEAVMKGWSIEKIAYYKHKSKLLIEKRKKDDIDKEYNEEDDDETNGIVMSMEDNDVKGLSSFEKQKEVVNFIIEEKLHVCVVLETRLKSKRIDKVCSSIFGRWNWFINMRYCNKGCKIMVGWNKDEVSMSVLHMARQSVLLKMETRNDNVKMFETFIYSSNGGLERKELWKDLEIYKRRIRNEPWVLSRDLNVTLNPSEHSAGGFNMSNDMKDFQKYAFSKILVENKPLEQIKDMETLFQHKLNNKEVEYMIREINDEELKNAMFQIDDKKAPGKILKEINLTLIALVPKVQTPLKVYNFRPIACCNVIYKCIRKILTDRIKGCLDKLESIKEFGKVDGLIQNYNKSTILFVCLNEEEKHDILDIMLLKVERLSIRYLGVPLTSKRIRVKECKILIDKVESRISNYKNKCLSYAGRLMLVASVLESIHVYWTSVFLLPVRVIKDINKFLKNFLWNHNNGTKGKAKVA